MFAIIFSPAVLALFWMSMIEKKVLLRQIFTAAAMLGFGLILWSGTRSAIIGVLLGIGILWYVFRARIMVLLFALAVFGLVLQIVASGSADVTAISDRLQTVDTGRTELWAYYFPIGLDSPIYGYSVTGIGKAIVGGARANFLDSQGASAVKYGGFHNAYLAMFVQVGGVGVGLLFLLLGLAMRRARQVVFSPDIPLEEKKVYVLPVAIMVVIAIEAIVEDIISATGKGTFVGLAYFSSLILCELHGRRLYEQYVTAKPKNDVDLKNQESLTSEKSSIAT
jgi:O-antigen ligase